MKGKNRKPITAISQPAFVTRLELTGATKDAILLSAIIETLIMAHAFIFFTLYVKHNNGVIGPNILLSFKLLNLKLE